MQIKAKCPFKDFKGKPIYDGDLIKHPSGQIGKVIFMSPYSNDHRQWQVDYGDVTLALFLQITEKGQAIVAN